MAFLSLVVPTKDRPQDMRKLLTSISKQTRLPDEIIVVDGSKPTIDDVIVDFPDLKIKHVPVYPPSLPKQRNAGIAASKNKSGWLGFLDDDVVLEKTALEEIEKCIHSNGSNLKGIGLSILNQPVSQVNWYNSLFLIGDSSGGKVTKAGFPSAIPPATNDMSVEWLYGGATFWNVSVFENFSYDEWFQGTGYMEDVDFSYAVSKKHELKVCSKAQCYHNSHPIRRSRQLGMGEWQLTSWWYFVKKYKHFSYPLVFWGMTGVFLKNALSVLIKRSPDAALRCLGNLRASLKIVNGSALRHKGFSK